MNSWLVWCSSTIIRFINLIKLQEYKAIFGNVEPTTATKKKQEQKYVKFVLKCKNVVIGLMAPSTLR